MKRDPSVIDFGKRLVKFRKAQGLTQQQLGDKIGVTRRIIAYYEGETNFPPAHLIVPLSRALDISTDELLGARVAGETLDPRFSALWRRLKILEMFSERERRAVLQIIEMIGEKYKAKKTRGSGAPLSVEYRRQDCMDAKS